MDELKFVGELRFPGIGMIDRKYRVDSLRDRLELPICCVTTRLATDFSATMNAERFVFRLMGMYPSNFSANGKPSQITGIYELEEIAR